MNAYPLVLPPWSMATSEKFNLRFDFTEALEALGTGLSVSSVASVLTDLGAMPPAPITLVDNPTITGSVVGQIVRGSALTGIGVGTALTGGAFHSYELAVTATLSDGEIQTVILPIEVPE